MSRAARSPTASTTADIITNDQISKRDEYKPLIIGYHNGAAVRLSDVADVVDSTQNIRTAGYMDGIRGGVHHHLPPARRQHHRDRRPHPGAAAISRGGAAARASRPPSCMDRTTTIRASVRDVERTLIGSIILVVLVVFVFLRSPRATLIPSVAVPVSLIGTFAVMYLLRLHARQSLADGADHRHRLRGGRCHRGDGKHHAPS